MRAGPAFSGAALIQQIRDETHRFAVTFHRLRRGKRQTKTALGDIPGIGPLTARRLLREFGSVANLQRAEWKTEQGGDAEKRGENSGAFERGGGRRWSGKPYQLACMEWCLVVLYDFNGGSYG